MFNARNQSNANLANSQVSNEQLVAALESEIPKALTYHPEEEEEYS
jgi:hypothetical protein